MILGVKEETWQALQEVAAATVRELPTVVVILVVAFLLNAAIRRSIDFLAARTSPTFSGPAKRAVKLFLVLAAVIAICGVYGADLGGLWTMLSATLALVALGFVAVWSVLSNVSCTVLILFFRPYEIGDELEFLDPAVKGTVVNLNFAYTTLRDDSGLLVQIPNNLFFQKIVKRRPGHYSTVSLAEQLKRETAKEMTPSVSDN